MSAPPSMSLSGDGSPAPLPPFPLDQPRLGGGNVPALAGLDPVGPPATAPAGVQARPAEALPRGTSHRTAPVPVSGPRPPRRSPACDDTSTTPRARRGRAAVGRNG